MCSSEVFFNWTYWGGIGSQNSTGSKCTTHRTSTAHCIVHRWPRVHLKCFVLTTALSFVHTVSYEEGPNVPSDIPNHLPVFHLSELMQSLEFIVPGDRVLPTASAEAPRVRSGWRCRRHWCRHRGCPSIRSAVPGRLSSSPLHFPIPRLRDKQTSKLEYPWTSTLNNFCSIFEMPSGYNYLSIRLCLNI